MEELLWQKKSCRRGGVVGCRGGFVVEVVIKIENSRLQP